MFFAILPITACFFLSVPSSSGAELGSAIALGTMESCFLSRASYLLSGVSAAGDDGDSADLEELHLVRRVCCRVCWLVKLRGDVKTVENAPIFCVVWASKGW
jgi:hypothetical protein